MNNAIAAIDGEGALEIAVDEVDDGILVRIRDDGRGIEPERLERIFEPGFSNKPSGRVGLSMGLALSQRLVEEIGGTLAIDSTLGQGTEVTVALKRHGTPG